MQILTLSTLAWEHIRNSAAKETYLRSGCDHTKPATFSGLINVRCNVRRDRMRAAMSYYLSFTEDFDRQRQDGCSTLEGAEVSEHGLRCNLRQVMTPGMSRPLLK